MRSWLIALIIGLSAMAGLPSSAAARVVWTADTSRPLLQEWASFASASANRFSQVTKDHRRAYRIDLLDGDSSYIYADRSPSAVQLHGGPYGERAELAQGNAANPAMLDRLFYEGQEQWISWQVMLPRDYVASSASWNLILQFKHIGPTPGTSHDMRIFKDRAGRGVYEWEWHSIRDATDVWPVRRGHGTIATNRWIRFTAHVKWSPDPSVGFFELWGDTVRPGTMAQLVPKAHHATMKRATGSTLDPAGPTVPAHTRLGIYRDPLLVGDSKVWYAGFTVATTRAEAEGSAFGATGTRAASGARLRTAGATRRHRARAEAPAARFRAGSPQARPQRAAAPAPR